MKILTLVILLSALMTTSAFCYDDYAAEQEYNKRVGDALVNSLMYLDANGWGKSYHENFIQPMEKKEETCAIVPRLNGFGDQTGWKKVCE